MEVKRDFPLFPLRLVALPGELIPLHIFEDRYKAMIAHCLEEPSEFGIVCTDDSGQRETGCACEVAEVLERFDDGRMNLVARGTRPFVVETEQAGLPYPAGGVRFLADEADEPEADLLAQVHEAYAELVRTATDRTPDLTEIAGMSAYDMAGTVEFSLDDKQELLEARLEGERLRLLLALIQGAIRRMGVVERAQAVAASNGKVRFGPKPDELS